MGCRPSEAVFRDRLRQISTGPRTDRSSVRDVDVGPGFTLLDFRLTPMKTGASHAFGVKKNSEARSSVDESPSVDNSVLYRRSED